MKATEEKEVIRSIVQNIQKNKPISKQKENRRIKRKRQVCSSSLKILDFTNDAIDQLVHSTEQQKLVEKWNTLDFVKHLNSGLSSHKCRTLIKARRGSVDCVRMLELFDKISDEVDTEASKQDVKDYIDWWMTNKAQSFSVSKRGVTMKLLMNSTSIKDFCREERIQKVKPKSKSVMISATDKPNDQVYKFGGTLALLHNKGIVNTMLYLSSIKGSEPAQSEIHTCLSKVSENMQSEIIERTIQLKPYPTSDTFDWLTCVPNSKVAKKYRHVQIFKS